MELFDFYKKTLPAEAKPVSNETAETPAVQSPVRIKMDRPYFDSDGGLVIPFEGDKTYHWWDGGQSIADTIKEISGDVDSRNLHK